MDYDTAFAALIGHEGGYVNDPRDPGGETKFGLSKRTYPTLEISSLTEYDAKAIYKRDFWDKVRASELPPDVRFDIFDAAVNSGVGQAVKWLQRTVGTTEDGVLGPITLAAARVLPGSVVKARYNGHRLMFMTDLKVWPAFSRGWARRIATNLLEA